MLSDKERKAWNDLDDLAAKCGGYVAPPKRPIVIEYDYRAMSKYCTEKGIEPMELSEEELQLFLYDEPLVYA